MSPCPPRNMKAVENCPKSPPPALFIVFNLENTMIGTVGILGQTPIIGPLLLFCQRHEKSRGTRGHGDMAKKKFLFNQLRKVCVPRAVGTKAEKVGTRTGKRALRLGEGRKCADSFTG